MEKEDDRLEKLLSKVEPISDVDAAQDMAVLENLKKGSDIIDKAVARAKQTILESKPDEHKQAKFSFMPTDLTRISPFWPMSRRELKNRPFRGGMTWETSWGRIIVDSGNECLAIYDETVLLAILEIVKQEGSIAINISTYELGKMITKNPSNSTYSALWRSLDMLMGTKLKVEIWTGKGKQRKIRQSMMGSIISYVGLDHETNKLEIQVNEFFLKMFAEGLITNINVSLRSSLKGDTSKALYRFFQSQRNYDYRCHFLTIAKAINLDIANTPNYEMKKLLRKGLAELKKAGYLRKWTMPKDIMTAWKSAKPVKTR